MEMPLLTYNLTDNVSRGRYCHSKFYLLIIIIMRVIYIAPKCVKQTHWRIRSHCTSAKRMTSILRHVAEAFRPPASQGPILNYHRVIGIAANISMVLNCALVTYIMMTACRCKTAGCSLTSYPRRTYILKKSREQRESKHV